MLKFRFFVVMMFCGALVCINSVQPEKSEDDFDSYVEIDSDNDDEVVEFRQSRDNDFNKLEKITQVPVRYDGAQVWRVNLTRKTYEQSVQILESQFGGSIWGKSDKEVDIFIKKRSLPDARELLAKTSVPFTVMIADMQKAIDNENPEHSAHNNELRQAGKLQMTWKDYHSLETISEYMKHMAKKYSHICQIMTIGQSANGKPLRVLRIADDSIAKRIIWIDGGIHAREWISPAVVTFMIQKFLSGWDKQPIDVRTTAWYIMPIMNPDGYEYTRTTDRLWRKNRRNIGSCIGVDLNRNFGYKWGGLGASRDSCSEIYRGPNAFSEPETIAVSNFLLGLQPKPVAYLTFHSYGQYILYPWGYGEAVPPDYPRLQKIGAAASRNAKLVAGTAYKVTPAYKPFGAAAGGSDDWAKGILRSDIVYTIELRDTGMHGFVLPATEILGTAKEALAMVKTISSFAARRR